MIDKINGNGVYEYQSGKQRKNSAAKVYEQTPAAKGSAKDNSAKMQKSSGTGDSRQGVILDLSPKTAEKKQIRTDEKKGFRLGDLLRRVLAPVFQRLKDFWESDGTKVDKKKEAEMPPERADGEAALAAQAEETDGLAALNKMEDVPAAGEITEEVLRLGDLKKIEQLLTAGGARRPARNSDLLTYYDRRGKIVEMDESERHRVLFGDKNVLKL